MSQEASARPSDNKGRRYSGSAKKARSLLAPLSGAAFVLLVGSWQPAFTQVLISPPLTITDFPGATGTNTPPSPTPSEIDALPGLDRRLTLPAFLLVLTIGLASILAWALGSRRR